MSRAYRRKDEDPIDFWLRHGQATKDGCIEVPAAKDKDGYPLVWIGGRKPTGKMVRLGRLVLERKLGRALQAFALHTCDNPACVNAAHLYDGTQKENRLDCARRGRTACGAANGKPRKLSEEAILDIRASRGHVPQRELAAKYGIHQVTVSKIQRRTNWAWM